MKYFQLMLLYDSRQLQTSQEGLFHQSLKSVEEKSENGQLLNESLTSISLAARSVSAPLRSNGQRTQGGALKGDDYMCMFLACVHRAVPPRWTAEPACMYKQM